MPFLADLHSLDRAPDSAADRALDVEQRATYAAAHTPGPWEAIGNLVRTCRKPDGRGGLLVAECPANIGNRIQDARLIAAAPDMLDALIQVRAVLAAAKADYPAESTAAHVLTLKIKLCSTVIDKAIGGEA